MELKGDLTLDKKYAFDSNKLTKTVFWIFVATFCVSIFMIQPVGAQDLFAQITSQSTSIYTKIVALSTPVLGALGGIALLCFMFPWSEKAAQQAKSWFVRCLVAWVVIQGMGFITGTLSPMLTGGTTL